jgi:hypothetical protein
MILIIIQEEIKLHIVRLIHALLLVFKQTLRRPRSGRLGTSEENREIVGVKACGDPTKSCDFNFRSYVKLLV